MPLPAGGAVPWPPEHCQPINTQYHTWAAWYGGDAEQLAAIYTGAGDGQGHDTYGFFTSQQGGFKAGVRKMAAAVRRWFWGAQTSATQQRTRLHVPLAGDIASASADMLFSEPPTFTIPIAAIPADTPADPTQARLDQLIDDGTHATLLEAAEICAALGGVYLRVVWDPATRPDRPWLTAVHPDVAVPEWAWGKLVAVTFWRELRRAGRLVTRHLERHEPGKIIHGVYQGTEDELGQAVPLADYPETANLADERLVNGNEILTGAPGLTAVYVPNMRPNRLWRNNPHAAYLGRSDYAGVEPLMDALDMTYSSWMRDVDLGKARLIVPREYLQSNGRGQGASVDLDQEVYEPVNMIGSESGGAEITQVQFAIRVEEHSSTVDKLKATIVGAAGYSAQTFGLDGDGVAVTATEIAAKNRRSLITRDRKARYWIPALRDIIEALLWVDKAQFGSVIEPMAPDVEFADAVSADPLQVAQTLRELDTAGAISTEMKVRTLHPDWDDTQVMEEVERIKGPAVEDPATFTGVGLDDDEY
jgi:hypothetical protein